MTSWSEGIGLKLSHRPALGQSCDLTVAAEAARDKQGHQMPWRRASHTEDLKNKTGSPPALQVSPHGSGCARNPFKNGQHSQRILEIIANKVLRRTRV
jgi:hypothetical protein